MDDRFCLFGLRAQAKENRMCTMSAISTKIQNSIVFMEHSDSQSSVLGFEKKKSTGSDALGVKRVVMAGVEHHRPWLSGCCVQTSSINSTHVLARTKNCQPCLRPNGQNQEG